MEKRKIFMTTAGGGGFPRLARVMTCLMLMLTGLGTGVKAADVDLSTLAADYTAQNGDVLTGTLSQNVKITVADGATVTLKDAVINGTNNDSWAGLNLAGDGTIVLKGENTVKGFYDEYPGIYVPENKTVTIKGDGSLTASSNGYGAGIGGGLSINCGNIAIEGGTITATGGEYAAGIGGGYGKACGNISITGGTITATGGEGAAGIGSGFDAACGNILITGGTITATGGSGAAGIGGGVDAACGNILITGGTITATGGFYAAGIGSGYEGSCGNITITDGVTKVTATKGEDAPNSIGKGYDGSCGTVTIGGTETGNISTSPYTYTGTGGSAPAAEGFTVSLKDGVKDADKWTVKVGDGQAQELPIGGLKGDGSETVTLQYTGRLKVKGVKATSDAAPAVTWNTVDLSALTGDYTAQDGDKLTGTLSGNKKISIADGATVMLDGVTINGANNESYKWAGLTLAGDGTIILSGENSVKGFYDEYPGIFVPENKTLTIQGDGSLTASSNGYGAGIGGGYQIACGNITIEGGTITATGGSTAAGIGGGRYRTCGDITIANTVTKVTATKGANANSIGAGMSGTCGTVTIGGTVTGNITESPYTYQP